MGQWGLSAVPPAAAQAAQLSPQCRCAKQQMAKNQTHKPADRQRPLWHVGHEVLQWVLVELLCSVPINQNLC